MFKRDKAPAQRRTADNGNQQPHSTSRIKTIKHGDRYADGSSTATAANGSAASNDGHDDDDPRAVTVHSSLLQPRVAVVLGLSKYWYPLLFACRLLSIVPALCWGFSSGLRLLAMLHLMFFGRASQKDGLTRPDAGAGASPAGGVYPLDMSFETRLRLTETLLATIWVLSRHPYSFQHQQSALSLTKPIYPSAAHQDISPFSSPTASCLDGALSSPLNPPAASVWPRSEK